MSVNGAPIALTVGQTVQVPQTVSGATNLSGIMLLNLSPYLLELQVGLLQDWIGPYAAYPAPQTQLATITVTPQLIGGAPPAGSPASLVPTYYLQGETMPDPMTFTAAALSAAISGTVTTQSPAKKIGEWQTGRPGGTSPVFTVDPGTQSLIIATNGPGVPVVLSPSGGISNVQVQAVVPATDPWFGVGSSTVTLYSGTFPVGLNYIVVPWEVFASQVQLNVATFDTIDNFWVFQSPIALQPTDPADTLTRLPASVAVVLGNSGVSVVVNGVVGSTVTIYSWALSVAPDSPPSGAGHWVAALADTAGANSFARVAASVLTNAGSSGMQGTGVIPGGLALPVGRGIEVQASTGPGANININGTVIYTQG